MAHIPEIIFEDNHLIAINKPFTMPSQGDESGDENALDWTKAWIKETYQKPGNVYLGLLHRLDRPTGGILVFAKTSKAAQRVSKQFQDRKVKKVYLAITEGTPTPPDGTLTHYLRKMQGKNIVQAFRKEVAHSKLARLDYRVLQEADQKALLAVFPATGRRHQIRVQLASIHCPIKGDVKYGKTSFNPDKSICLFAKEIALEHPIQKHELILRAPMPQTHAWKAFRIPDAIL